MHGMEEVIERGVDVMALQLLLVRKRHSVNKEIQAAPFLFERGENGVEVAFLAHVTRQEHFAANFLHQRRNALFEGIALIGKSEIGAMRAQRAGNTPGD